MVEGEDHCYILDIAVEEVRFHSYFQISTRPSALKLNYGVLMVETDGLARIEVEVERYSSPVGVVGDRRIGSADDIHLLHLLDDGRRRGRNSKTFSEGDSLSWVSMAL